MNWSSAIQSLIKQISASEKPKPFQVLRLTVGILPVDLLAFLSAVKTKEKFYWSSRMENFAMAGIGICHEANRIRVADYLNHSTLDLRYLGAISFENKENDFRFILPQIEIRQVQNQFFLACHLVCNEEWKWISSKIRLITLLKDLSNISFKNKDFYSLQPVCVNELPNYAKWKSNLDEILSDIENQKIKKLVLARKVTKEFAHAVDALQIITYLKQNINLAYHFYWQYEENIAFVGASPEQLYKRENRRIYTEAQAGTRPRGSCESDDSQYAEELLNSDKDKLEHDYVLNEIESILKDLCLDFGLTTHRDIIKLSKVQHLRSCFSGILKNGIDDFVILEKLHPTSAVCGLPKKKALEKIAELEPFERGYYAGAIGYLSKDYAEFCVGIRSVLVEENQLSLYAGAGIVKGSKPNEEWQEIQNKMSLFERICHEPLPK